MIRMTELRLPLEAADPIAVLRQAAAKRLKVSPEQITELTLVKKSIDARKKDKICFRCTVELTMPQEDVVLRRAKDKKAELAKPFVYTIPKHTTLSQRPVVVGFGPAGMFAALLLAQAGQRPIVLERGDCVEDRQQAVCRFWQDGELDPESNVQFGEGGAGTFSDGKLNTGTKDPRSRKVLQELVAAGAPAEILWEAHPHVGTDRLPTAVRTIRETICSLGGAVHFRSRLTGIRQKEHRVIGVTAETPQGSLSLDTGHVILAIGHSARDTYTMLREMGVTMEAKAFSVGARIEHPQESINRAQFGAFAQHPALGAAEYKLAVHLPNGRGVYTFCMCPGGTVVAAASEAGQVVTNGMSNFARDGQNANAALLVGVQPEDFGSEDVLAGVAFQRKLERAAFLAGGGAYRAPMQLVGDFLNRQPSKQLGSVEATYQRGGTPSNLHEVLPAFVAESMAEGILQMDRRLHGFAHPEAILTGVETRSSAPVRLLRNQQLQSVSLEGLYPCGEGAGYAGGIVSAAVDGLRCAEQVLRESGLE